MLLRAARDAWEHGSPHAAAAYLQRAADERAPGDDRGAILARLATISFDAGLPDAKQRLREALNEARDHARRIDVLTRLAGLSTVDMSDTGLSELLEHERGADGDPGVRLAIEAAVLDALLALPERHDERARRAAAADTVAAADPLLTRVVLSHRGWLGIERGTPDADRAASLAADAVEDDMLLSVVRKRAAFILAVRTLTFTDRVDDAARLIASMRDEAVARGSMWLLAAAAWCAAELALRRGRVADAENEARFVLDLADGDINVFTRGALEMLLLALAERGAVDEARDLLREHRLEGAIGDGPWEAGVLLASARVALAEGDFERARAEAHRAGAVRARQGRTNPTISPWRSIAALALSRLGRRDEAVVLADAELDLAERFGAPHPIVGALHARIVSEADLPARLALCERALALPAPDVLEHARVRLQLGATLRRMGRRMEARVELQRALADADAAGATLVAKEARRELVATGLRPRRAQIEGPEALTPRQRQVSDLAAAGVPNREIAQQLFLSIKTVETHLAASYRKLGVETRDELAAELRSAG